MTTSIRTCVLIVTLGVSAHAQDRTVTSKTTVKGDDVKTIVMRGCLGERPGSSVFTLTGGITAAGEDLKSETRRKTDVDAGNTTVKEKTKTKVDNDDHTTVLATGPYTTYEVIPRASVNLSPYVGHQVEITALMLNRAKGDDDAKVKIKEETKVDREDAADSKTTTETKAKLPRGVNARLTAISVRQISPTCPIQ